jgi:hypothetical protein
MLAHFHEITGIKHHMTIPYSKEEKCIVERANKEVNRHIRNILFDRKIPKLVQDAIHDPEAFELFHQTTTGRFPEYSYFW